MQIFSLEFGVLRLCKISNDIKIYGMQPCNQNVYYPVTVDNVHLEIKNGYVYVSGSLTSDLNITSPVKATLVAKRKIGNIWIEIPCIANIGSCPFSDLCSFGLPANQTCPEHFVKDKVPCRCPIPEGTYEMQPENKFPLFKIPENIDVVSIRNVPKFMLYKHLIQSYSTPATGTYWVQASITHENRHLTCYECYIDYNDELSKNKVEPLIELVL
ncbi:ganglioside GM2 activator-like isoform X2 [Euwallacea similis]|uniref:ganglioside GM2 activator-like isoform X2 n=1 Tax=Euwallacea similis TaxID=1736056 RepID=UPI003451012D